MEVLENGREMFAVGNEDEATKILSREVDDEKVKEGNCRGFFMGWVSTKVDDSMGKQDGIEIEVEVKE